MPQSHDHAPRTFTVSENDPPTVLLGNVPGATLLAALRWPHAASRSRTAPARASNGAPLATPVPPV